MSPSLFFLFLEGVKVFASDDRRVPGVIDDGWVSADGNRPPGAKRDAL